MARIRSFEQQSTSSRRRQTEVDCGWQVVEVDGETLLQLDTYGSDDRKLTGKVSQTIQLDVERAAELMEIVRRAFPAV